MSTIQNTSCVALVTLEGSTEIRKSSTGLGVLCTGVLCASEFNTAAIMAEMMILENSMISLCKKN